jgi:hypothetical protein
MTTYSTEAVIWGVVAAAVSSRAVLLLLSDPLPHSRGEAAQQIEFEIRMQSPVMLFGD